MRVELWIQVQLQMDPERKKHHYRNLSAFTYLLVYITAQTYVNYLVQRLYDCLFENDQKNDMQSSERLLDMLKSLLEPVTMTDALLAQLSTIYQLCKPSVEADLTWLSNYISTGQQNNLFIETTNTCANRR